MADTDHDFPFKAEYAKSGRSSCKLCKNSISKETLRLARMVQSPVFDGKIPNWFHFACFWKKATVQAYTDIGGFDNLRWDDQQKIKEKLNGIDSGTASKSKGKKGGAAELADFAVEYAKSNRSTCKACDEKIAKDDIRISKKDYERAAEKNIPGPVDLWHHVECFIEPDRLEEMGWKDTYSGEQLSGYKTLKVDDQKDLKKKLTPKRKVSDETDSVPKKKIKMELSKEEKQLKSQSEFLWKIRDQLYRHVPNENLKYLLTANNQDIPSGESKLLDYVSDGMAFGALENCPECTNGQLVVSSSGYGYHCTGNISSWTKCQYRSQVVKRSKWIIPDDLKDIEYLKTFKFKPFNGGVRVFPPEPSASSARPGTDATNVKTEKDLPLENAKIVLCSGLSKTSKELKKQITLLGGSVVTKVDASVACVIATKEEIESMSKKIKNSRMHNVHVVSEDFLEDVKTGGAALMISKHSICDWGSDPHTRLVKDEVDGAGPSKKSAKSGAAGKSGTNMVKMTVKGAATVDPDSNLEAQAHVLKMNDKLYSVTLSMVDITRGTNSYYKLQLLEADNGNKYYIFRSWGRVGTIIGGNKLSSFSDRSHAIRDFCDVYKEKTGNKFGCEDFVKKPNKFFPIDIDYGEEESKIRSMDAKSGTKSSLPSPIQDLIRRIFDVKLMKETLLEFEIDLQKMPLGKLSKKQIDNAYTVLSELQKHVEDKAGPNAFLDASNRFYTLIPHDFGLQKPPLLDTLEVIKSKCQMLDSLLEIEVAYSLLKGGDDDQSKDPVDVHYESLKCQMEVVEKGSDEFDMITTYVANTHAKTHSSYKLEVLDVLKIKREGESKRHKPFRKLPNRYLLWHGSRTTNFAGILSQGLRIAPPEAPVTGYMFGKGLYFADMVSKSANYCFTSSSNPVGLLLLSEVALGNMYEKLSSEYITKLPHDKQSTKGCGSTAPDSTGNITLDNGTIVPMGKSINTGVRGSLLYNEYIVYDVAQVEMKYLLTVKFIYK
ncbi:poly [ADP-ribose] polymerase 1-like [Anneissia japonica]|uniref:poly [ADP-ribose] polymerase 1-like n=1 Tax=Anneissia japonica TaxID=1529436 RepID=UPI00142552C5|nr:poly [ADP-ribose] polymerase 1-like [Anneissia japonica]